MCSRTREARMIRETAGVSCVRSPTQRVVVLCVEYRACLLPQSLMEVCTPVQSRHSVSRTMAQEQVRNPPRVVSCYALSELDELRKSVDDLRCIVSNAEPSTATAEKRVNTGVTPYQVGGTTVPM